MRCTGGAGSPPSARPRAGAGLGEPRWCVTRTGQPWQSPKCTQGWRPRGSVLHARPRAHEWCGGLQVQENDKDSIGEASTRCGHPSQHGSRGCHAEPAQVATAAPPWGPGMSSWPCPRCQALASHMAGMRLPVLRHGDSTDHPLHCRVKGESWETIFGPSNQGLACRISVSHRQTRGAERALYHQRLQGDSAHDEYTGRHSRLLP